MHHRPSSTVSQPRPHPNPHRIQETKTPKYPSVPPTTALIRPSLLLPPIEKLTPSPPLVFSPANGIAKTSSGLLSTPRSPLPLTNCDVSARLSPTPPHQMNTRIRRRHLAFSSLPSKSSPLHSHGIATPTLQTRSSASPNTDRNVGGPHGWAIGSLRNALPTPGAFSFTSNKFPEFEMPSVTWGVIRGRKDKLVSKVLITDYLKSIGIVPDELEDLELPSTVEVMRERVEFLQRLGLTIDDINEFPLMLGCSVRKNMIPVLGYLEKIGIDRPRLGEFVRKYPQALHASVVVELVPVVKFLRGLDVEKGDIPFVLCKYPDLLGFKPEGTMSTSVAYLVSIGIRPRDIGPMVTQYPFFLGMRVGTRIMPLVDYLMSLGLPKMVLARMIEKRPNLLGYDLEETVKPNVETLLQFGIRKEAIPSIVAQYPQILGLPLKAKLSTQQYFLNLKLKIDPDRFARVIEKMPQVASLTQNVIMKPVEFLKDRGIPVGDIAKMVVRCPQLMVVQVQLMKNSLYFLKSEMQRPVEEVVGFPEYFTYSLESRIKPRYQKLASKGIRCSLDWFLNCSDRRFEERLQALFIEPEIPGPSFSMGGKLEMPRSKILSDEEEESEDEVLYRRTISL